MIARNVTESDLHLACTEVRARYGGNVCFQHLDPKGPSGRRWSFRLTVLDSKGPGARVSPSGRRVKAACWHVHGHFFDALLSLNKGAVIQTRGSAVKVTSEGGNWHDWNAGSIMNPVRASQLCNCH